MAKPIIYKYSAFGLTIDSEFSLPELAYGKGAADADIVNGAVPYDACDPDTTYIMSRANFTFKIEGVAKYSIQNGRRIVVEPYEQADPQTIRVYLLGTGIGMLLIQKGLVPVHGSAVAINGKAVIFTGGCGAGKTTLCSWFQKCGYGFLSDDISAIRLNSGGIPMVQPAFSQQRICKDAAAQLGVNIEGLPPACLQDDKYIISPKDLFINRQMPLQSIVEITEAETGAVTLKKITGLEKIHHLMKNIYCFLLYEEMGFSKAYFEQCMRIVQQIEVYQLIRPKGIFSAEEQMGLVLKAIK